MISRKNVGRLLFFGLGYVAGTRAGRERYAQIQAGAKALAAAVRNGGAERGATSSGPGRRPADDPYGDITLGRS